MQSLSVNCAHQGVEAQGLAALNVLSLTLVGKDLLGRARQHASSTVEETAGWTEAMAFLDTVVCVQCKSGNDRTAGATSIVTTALHFSKWLGTSLGLDQMYFTDSEATAEGTAKPWSPSSRQSSELATVATTASATVVRPGTRLSQSGSSASTVAAAASSLAGGQPASIAAASEKNADKKGNNGVDLPSSNTAQTLKTELTAENLAQLASQLVGQKSAAPASQGAKQLRAAALGRLGVARNLFSRILEVVAMPNIKHNRGPEGKAKFGLKAVGRVKHPSIGHYRPPEAPSALDRAAKMPKSKVERWLGNSDNVFAEPPAEPDDLT